LDPVEWELIWDTLKEILTPSGLNEYWELFKEEEDLLMQWEAAVNHPPLGVNLMIRQLGHDDIQAMEDKENYYDNS
jgi:hypothetical protein